MSKYTGRFAPSPTGRLHFGSVLAAAASYLDARACAGRWLVRMEDLDTPRVVPGAADEILLTLDALGFEWDGPVFYQSTRSAAYSAALERLRASGAAYGCCCSRKEVGSLQYPGTCREAVLPSERIRAWRVRVPDYQLCFDDRVQGCFCQNLEKEVGDFVVLRSDGLFAYQLGVVVDDAEQGITDVVRGADLLDSTPRQLWLQKLLGYPQPTYLHIPVAVNDQGQKLSKQTLAPPVDANAGTDLLRAVLRTLGQAEPQTECIQDFWAEASVAWDPQKVPRSQRMLTTA